MSPILWVHYKEQTPGKITSCRLFCMVSGRKWRISGAFKITADYLQAMGVTRARFGVWEQSFFLFLINPFFKEKCVLKGWQAQQIHCWSSAKTQWKCSEKSSIKQTHSSDFSKIHCEIAKVRAFTSNIFFKYRIKWKGLPIVTNMDKCYIIIYKYKNKKYIFSVNI